MSLKRVLGQVVKGPDWKHMFTLVEELNMMGVTKVVWTADAGWGQVEWLERREFTPETEDQTRRELHSLLIKAVYDSRALKEAVR